MNQMVWEPVKSKEELAALLVWAMLNDRPVDGWSNNDAKIRAYANSQARAFGFTDWVDAYHNLEEVDWIR